MSIGVASFIRHGVAGTLAVLQRELFPHSGGSGGAEDDAALKQRDELPSLPERLLPGAAGVQMLSENYISSMFIP